jgi:hypothetical protein
VLGQAVVGLKRTLAVDPHEPALHALLQGAREHFRVTWGEPDPYLSPRKQNIVDARVTPSGVAGVISTLNELFLALER